MNERLASRQTENKKSKGVREEQGINERIREREREREEGPGSVGGTYVCVCIICYVYVCDSVDYICANPKLYNIKGGKQEEIGRERSRRQKRKKSD